VGGGGEEGREGRWGERGENTSGGDIDRASGEREREREREIEKGEWGCDMV
jgi:hypothetical protein